MKLDDSNEGRKAQIPLVPLIDVVFLLLAAFVVATLSMTVVRGMTVDLPKAKGEISESDLVLIGVSVDNRITLQGAEVTLSEAANEASGTGKARGVPIVIRGDKGSGLGTTVSLIDELRARGVESISFQVEN